MTYLVVLRNASNQRFGYLIVLPEQNATGLESRLQSAKAGFQT